VNSKEVLQKMASDIASPAQGIQKWALPEQEALPLDTPEFAARSAVEFDKQASKLSTKDKLAAARLISDVIDGYAGMATKLAGDKLSPYFKAFISMRKTATANLFNEDLDNLIEVAEFLNENNHPALRRGGLDKVANALDDFDREHNLSVMWDEQFPNPAYTVFGTTLRMGEHPTEDRAKVASFDVGNTDFDGFNWDCLNGKLEEAVVEGMKSADDKMAVFKSLPMPHREIIAQEMRGVR
jgi:hypothetical protein